MTAALASTVQTGMQKLGLQDTSNDLRPKLKGVVDSRYNGQLTHYRGIPYATIKERFAKPQLKKFQTDNSDLTKFGPRCPQIKFDTRVYMHIPRTIHSDESSAEDELKCTNLNVTCPVEGSDLPVYMWIYGGSMFTAYGTGQQRIGDAGPLVAQSIELGKPIVLVQINYRLNIFGFGDGDTEVNLSLEDQHTALKWIKQNIASFGGDPNNITVGGESAGSIYTHGLLASGAQFERAILQSGSLYTSPPQPDRAGFGFAGLIAGNLQLMEFDKGNQSGNFGPEATMIGAPAESLVQCLTDLKITRFWLWDEPYFKGWDDDSKVFGKLKGVLIGDCAHELTLWGDLFAKVPAATILKCFQTKDPAIGEKLAKMYGIDGLVDDHDTVRKEALDFLADARFNAWAGRIRANVNAAGQKAYQYYYDEGNPFMKDPKAGHGVDLLALFGGYDDEVPDEQKRIGRMLRTKWIDFINGEEPWSTSETYVFGPQGITGAIDRGSSASVHDLNTRRSTSRLEAIREVGWKGAMEVWQNLLAINQDDSD